MDIINLTKRVGALAFAIHLTAITLISCSSNTQTTDSTPTSNSAKMITDQNKLNMIHSLIDLEGDKGRIYEMTYTEDYKLDEALIADIDGTESLTKFVASHLMDTKPDSGKMTLSYHAGCSAFACPDSESGDFLMGRNFDFNHLSPGTGERIMIPLIVVHTAPKGAKKSVSFVDGLFVGYRSGFFNDGKSDLSMLMALPYLLLDGINEDGLAVSVLKLDGKPTLQNDPGKKKIFTTIAMRMVLDRASTVKEAIEMLKQYNMCMDKEVASYHFFMADASGDYAIVEYTNADTNQHPNKMEVLTGKDALRCTTNFYVSPSMAETPHGILKSNHGKNRYDNLEKGLQKCGYKMTAQEAMDLLKVVSQGPDDDQSSTGFTQWSEVFNLTKRHVKLSILREWDKTFEFNIEQK
ncbi:MAG: linear amide C-N hydrolase [Sodaliphilus sp.]